MAAKRKPKTRHGATQPEDARRNAQVLLRLPPAVRDILRDQSDAQGIPVSGLVSALVLMTWGHLYKNAADDRGAESSQK